MSDVLGTDVGTLDDQGVRRLVSGQENVAVSVYRRWITPRGGLFYAPDYGYDVRERLNGDVDVDNLWTIEADLAAEALQDPRVIAADVSIAADPTTPNAWVIRATLATAEGPFPLVVAVGLLTVEMLDA